MSNFNSILQLKDYFLDEFEFKINESIYEENTLDINPKFSIDHKECIAHIRFEFSIEDDRTYARGALIGKFIYDETVDEDMAKELLVVNGVTILFPYLRAMISNLTNVANVPTIILPTINVIEYLKAKYDEKATD